MLRTKIKFRGAQIYLDPSEITDYSNDKLVEKFEVWMERVINDGLFIPTDYKKKAQDFMS